MIFRLFQKNPNGGGLRTYIFVKKSWIFEVCHFALGNYGQKKAFLTLGNFVKLCHTLWKFQGQKPSDETMVQRWRGPNKEMFYLIHKENIKKTKEILRKPWKL